MTTQALQQAKEALEHDVPGSCWATGPLTGNFIEDLIVCPGCRAIAAIDAALATASSGGDELIIECAMRCGIPEVEHAARTCMAWFHGAEFPALDVNSDASPSPSVQPSDEQMEKARDAVAEALGDAYDCTRVWSAWGYETMTRDDFSMVAEDSDRVAEITDAAIKAILSTQPAAQTQGAGQAGMLRATLYAIAHTLDDHELRKTAKEAYEASFAQPAQPISEAQPVTLTDDEIVAMSSRAGLPCFNDEHRKRSIRLVRDALAASTAPDVRPSEMELRNEIAELKSYLDLVAPEDGFTDAVVLSINQAQRIQETVFILSNMVDSTQQHGESSRQRVAEAAKALCKKQPVPSQPASVPVSDEQSYLHWCQTLIKALQRLSLAAQTTGGTAGPDAELQAAIAEAERAMSPGACSAAIDKAEAVQAAEKPRDWIKSKGRRSRRGGRYWHAKERDDDTNDCIVTSFFTEAEAKQFCEQHADHEYFYWED